MSRSTVILIILGLLVLGAAWYLLFGKGNDSAAVSSTGSTPASAAELTFIGLTARIDPVTFDTSILSDPRFEALTDIRTAIVPEVSGRPNPFAPFPGSSR